MAYMPISGRFGTGINNPRFGFNNANPTGWDMPNDAVAKPVTPTDTTTSASSGGIATRYWVPPKPQAPPINYNRTRGQAPPINTTPGWLLKLRREAGKGEFDYPTAPDFLKYEGNMWEAPAMDIPEAGVDTRAVVNATGAYLTEKMNDEMADAARKFGSLGTLMSGGGLGGGYSGTLAESQRGRDRDLAALQYQYDYDAAQQDANRRSTARENALNRSLSAFTDYEGRNYGAWDAENAWNQWKYGTDVGRYQAKSDFDREQLQQLLSLYGY